MTAKSVLMRPRARAPPLLLDSRGVRSLIFSTPTTLLYFKNWLLLLVRLLITQSLSTYPV